MRHVAPPPPYRRLLRRQAPSPPSRLASAALRVEEHRVSVAEQTLNAVFQTLTTERRPFVSFSDPTYDYDSISPFSAGSVAAGVLGAYGALLSIFVQKRNQEDTSRPVTIAIRQASLSLLSFALNHPTTPKPMPWKNLGIAVTYDYYISSDGVPLYIHPGYRQEPFCSFFCVDSAEGLRSASMLSDNEQFQGFLKRKADIQAAIKRRTFKEIWEACNNPSLKLSVCPVLSHDEFLSTEQGKALLVCGPVDVICIDNRECSESTPMDDIGWCTKPLQGIKVLELTRILAAPVAGKLLAEQGAEVLRIGAPFAVEDVGSFEVDTSIGKRFAQLDLRDGADRAKLDLLISNADVLLENFTADVFSERLGYTREKLMSLKPNLVHVKVSCYGHVGPWSSYRGWEWVAQACSGLGVEQARWQQPLDETSQGTRHTLHGARLPMLLTDYITGYLAAAGTAAALVKRFERVGYYEVRTSLCQASLLVQQHILREPKDSSIMFFDHSRVWSQALFDESAFLRFGMMPADLQLNFARSNSSAYGEILHLPPLVSIAGLVASYSLPPEARGSSVAEFTTDHSTENT